MKNKINSIDMNGKLDHEQIYNLFKTNSSKENKKISEKIDIFKNNIDFFEYYANKDIKNLLNIFGLKLLENKIGSSSSFKSDIEEYISCISQIILSIKLFFKTRDILKKMLINAKNNLLKLKEENKLENYNQECLFLYLESLLQNSDKSLKFNSCTSIILHNNISSFELIPKYSKFRKAFSENKSDEFSNDEIKSIIYDNPSTPKFESDEEFENHEKKNSNLENSIECHSTIKKDTIFTFSECVFSEESSTLQNIESKLIGTSKIKPKIKNSTKVRMLQSEKANNIKHKRYLFSETDVTIKNDDKNNCRNLLEMINNMYKNGLINCEEKVKLKQLVIDKSKKIEYFYNNIYNDLNNDNNKLISEVKKIVN